jgi:hypothetical protein
MVLKVFGRTLEVNADYVQETIQMTSKVPFV